jgi:PAS domain S-box-containing protein
MAKPETARAACAEEGILENALTMIVVLDQKGTILAWNHAAETITGYLRDDVVGKTDIWKSLYPEKEYRQSVTAKIRKIISEKQYFENLETTIRTRSGSSRIILWNTKEIVQDGINRSIAVGLDVTEQRQADFFRSSIIDNAHILIAVLDHGTVLVWNQAAETITGYSRDLVVGKRDIWQQLYPDAEYRRNVTRQITEIIRKNRHFENLETTIVTRSGQKKIISWNTRQIGTEGTQQDIAIGLDITARKQAEDALFSYMTEMAMRLKGPIEIIRDNLTDVVNLIRSGKLDPEEIVLVLDGQIRITDQVAQNVLEFQRAVTKNNKEIPEAYRKFLAGE